MENSLVNQAISGSVRILSVSGLLLPLRWRRKLMGELGISLPRSVCMIEALGSPLILTRLWTIFATSVMREKWMTMQPAWGHIHSYELCIICAVLFSHCLSVASCNASGSAANWRLLFRTGQW